MTGTDRGATTGHDGALTLAEALPQLTLALDREAEGVRRLGDALVIQRAAVAADDQHGVESTVRAIGSVLTALERARRARANLVETLTGRADLPLDQLEEAIGVPLSEALATARAALRAAAQATAREAAVNRAVLRDVIGAGEAFLQALLTSAAPAPVYAPAGRRDDPVPGSLLVNRTA